MKTYFVAGMVAVLLPNLSAQVDFSISIESLTVDSRNHFWVGTQRGLFRARDANGAFNPVYMTAPGTLQSRVTSVAVMSSDPPLIYAATNLYRGGVWRSADDGATWVRANEGLPIVGRERLTLHAAGGDSGILYAMSDTALYRMSRGSSIWQKLSPLPSTVNGLNSAVFHVATPSVLLFSGGSGIYLSNDGGLTWEALNNPLGQNSRFVQISSLRTDPANPAVVYLAVALQADTSGSTLPYGFYRSGDGGKSWTKTLSAAVSSITVDGVDSRRIFVTGPGVGFETGSLYRSDDSGLTWSQQGSLRTVTNSGVTIDNANRDTLYVNGSPSFSGQIRLLRSLDGGQSWKPFGTTYLTIVSEPNTVQLNLAQGQSTSFFLELSPLELDVSSMNCIASVEGPGVRVESPVGTSRQVLLLVSSVPPGTTRRNVNVVCKESGPDPIRIPLRIDSVRPVDLNELSPPLINDLVLTGVDLGRPVRAQAIAADRQGNLFVTHRNGWIVKIFPSGPSVIVAGSRDSQREAEDGVPATSVRISATALAVNEEGTLFFVEGQSIWSVTADGILHKVSGSTVKTATGDSDAVNTIVLSPIGLAAASGGALLVAAPYRVVRIDGSSLAKTIAGDDLVDSAFPRELRFSGDGGPAIAAEFDRASALAVDRNGNIFVADTNNHRIRRISPDGVIVTIAGNGMAGFAGDGGPAAGATLFAPNSIAADSRGTVYFLDSGNRRVRAINPNGLIETVIGSGAGVGQSPQSSSACGMATLIQLATIASSNLPFAAIAVDGADNLFVYDYDGRIFFLPAAPVDAEGEARIRQNAPKITGLFSAASFRPATPSAGQLVTMTGTNLSTSTGRAPLLTLPLNLGNSFVCVGGTTAPLLFVSPGLINLQIPQRLDSNRPVVVGVSNGTRTGSLFSEFATASTDPGIFITEGDRAIAENEDGTRNTPDSPAAARTVVRIYLTGVGLIGLGDFVLDGQISPSQPLPSNWPSSASVGGLPGEIAYIGLVPGGAPGLGRADIRLPSLPAGDQLVTITINGNQSNSAVIAIRP